MKRFQKVFKNKFNVIGMVHLQALPGTPNYAGKLNEIVEKAKHEANIYAKHKVDGILIENMHDIPYVQSNSIGPEVIASIARIARDIKCTIPTDIPCGVQVLASANNQAIAIGKACDLQFIRAEGFVFAHVADEGWTNACAGELLRYRRNIDAQDVLIFTDIKKKHSSHSVTADTDLLETAKTAEFFLSDGIILTGNSTGDPIKIDDLNRVQKCKTPILIGSGCTVHNVEEYYNKCHAVIVGSHFKHGNEWQADLNEIAIRAFQDKVKDLRNFQK